MTTMELDRRGWDAYRTCRVIASGSLAIFIGAIAAPIGAGAADLEVDALDETDCAIIERYDARWGIPSMLEQFEAIALKMEWCVSEGGPCDLPYLRRWDRGITMALDFGRGVVPSGPSAQAALNGIDAGFTFVAETLGVNPSTFVSFEATEITPEDALVIVTIASLDEMADLARSHERFLPGLDLVGAAEIGVRLEPACWAVSSDTAAAPGRLLRSFIYIDQDLPIETLLACGKEEALNIFIGSDPIGDGSLFDDPWGRGPDHPELGEPFSARDAVLLRLLHHSRLHPGMPSAEVRREVADILRRDCG